MPLPVALDGRTGSENFPQTLQRKANAFLLIFLCMQPTGAWCFCASEVLNEEINL
jgi:hypothetical protein